MAKIMIIEPHAVVSRLVELQVEHLGHDPVRWSGADSFPHGCRVALVEPASPEALASAEALRTKRRDVKLVFVSVRQPSRESAALNPVAHLLKPYKLSQLQAAVERALRP